MSFRTLLSRTLLPLAFASVEAPSAQPAPAASPTFHVVNGRWFDGTTFRSGEWFVVNGRFTRRRPAHVDQRLDLRGGYVIPPFGDAHTHNLDGTRGLTEMVQRYLAEGTFYVQVLGNHGTWVADVRKQINTPRTIDAVFANGMLTGTLGHPFMVYEPLAMGIYDPREGERRLAEVKKSRLAENDAYWFLDTTADVDAQWSRILAQRPDLIKIGLLNADRPDLTGAVGGGLRPEIARYVVAKAHAAGLRVFAHIESASDFRLALDIGVDGLAHAPEYGWDGREESRPRDELTLADLRRAARRGVVVIPTAERSRYSVTDYGPDGTGTVDSMRLRRVVDRQRQLLQRLFEQGVVVALGLDTYGATLLPELQYLDTHRIVDRRTLLRTATVTTPRSIFPGRKIGKFAEGHEASFLVLDGNPIDDFSALTRIRTRVKQGVMLTAP